jgi:aminoglycoside phosphotransferase (APT) family kinase protein
LLAADADAVECDAPTLALSWMHGDPPDAPKDLARFIAGLARPLPAIHSSPTIEVSRTYEPYFVSDGLAPAQLEVPRWARNRSIWERLFDVVGGKAPDHRRHFIHRDYHHGNTVWNADSISGVIDWTAACVGPAGIDVSHMRINLAWDFDLETADGFLNAWRSVAGDDSYDPYWDLLDAADWLSYGEPDEGFAPDKLDRYEQFVARALADLS